MEPQHIHQDIPGGVPLKMWTRGVPVDDGAVRQLTNAARLPVVFRHIAAMPDVHVGIGATVGSVIPTRRAIIPAAVGVDIGCGMMACKTTLRAEDLPDNLEPLRAAMVSEDWYKKLPADRKAASSAAYRGSQTFRGLIAALIATVGVVLLIVLIVPRGDYTGSSAVDLQAAAKNAQSAMNRPLLVPTLPNNWRVNKAVLIDGKPVSLDAPFLRAGWHAAEDGLRWTTGMAYLPPALSVPGTKLEIDIRGRAWPAEVVKKPFYRRTPSA